MAKNMVQYLHFRILKFPLNDCWILVVGICGFRVSSKAGDIRSCFSKIRTPNPSLPQLSSFFFPTRNYHSLTVSILPAGYLHFLPNPARPSFHQWKFQLQTRIGVIEGLYIETGWCFGTCCFHILGISSSQPTRKHHPKISLLDPSDWQNLSMIGEDGIPLKRN